MIKRSGPDLNRQKLPLKRCQQCHGRGLVKPMFYEMPCPQCLGLGAVRADTGEHLEPEEAVTQLRIRLNEKEQELHTLRRQLADIRNESAGRGYGHGGSRYHGD